MKNKKKLLVPVMVVALVLATIGGTLAWLKAQTDEVKNTFTVGNVGVELAETTGNEYKLMPGHEYTKDPKVTLTDGSEDAWLFVEVIRSEGFDDCVTAAIADGWTKLDSEKTREVYYKESPKAGKAFPVLEGNKVTIKDLTNDTMPEVAPTLSFKAYAIQKDGFATVEKAWAEAQK